MAEPNRPTVTALILAGGRSSRMGTDKARIPWQGIPLLTRVVCAANQCCATVVVLTPWPEQYADWVPPTVQWLPEEHPDQGPLVALAQGLKQLNSTWVLLLACDLPCLDPQILQSWIQMTGAFPYSDPLAAAPPIWAYVPRSPQGWEPLCALYHVCCQSSLQTFIEQGGRSFQRWLGQIPVQTLPLTPRVSAMLWNCNTPQDLLEG
ncbi:molybdenum cofactor guanylyltransferase [Synechococcales cyanobacterium C]|uniref:Probable molybdenum cofactor guanylyltransferase n=1 Tax=Petrachloros mirabilis ULC683 TaxID=2781853 RepID=A0A8K1ZZ55_9CYAN|nr:molybdenum cofactor guanylyltransferase [Petrachloros mirabilis]NCJ06763.1 molybdenum cofactor guanylyltransferase [Petrachloros mirabilis ULC683]